MMKKILVTLMIVFAAAGTIQAQQDGMYIVGGANYSNYAGSDISSSDFKLGFHAGIMAVEQLNDKWQMNIGVTFNQVGDDVARLNTTAWMMSYGYKIKPKLWVHFGGQINVFVEARDRDGEKIDNGSDTFDGVYGDLIGKVSYAYSERLFAYSQYTFGLGDPFKDSELNIRSQVISLGIGWSFIR